MPAAAQLVDCDVIGGPQKRKIVIDNVSFDPGVIAGTMTPDQLRQLIAFNMGTMLSGIPVLTLAAVECAERTPSIDGAEFTDAIIEDLNTLGVVLEIWGHIIPFGTDAKVALGFAMIPVCRLGGDDDMDIGIQSLRYTIQRADSAEVIPTKLQSGVEFAVFASLAYGVKALRNKEFDVAQEVFCGALVRLEHAEQDSLPLALTDSAELRQYIEQKRQENFDKAKSVSDDEYNGWLKDYDALPTCGGGL